MTDHNWTDRASRSPLQANGKNEHCTEVRTAWTSAYTLLANTMRATVAEIDQEAFANALTDENYTTRATRTHLAS